MLRRLLDELVELLDDGAAGGGDEQDPLSSVFGSAEPRSRPDDPALARLLPDAYADDPEAAQDFRRYTEGDLRRDKVDAATVAKNTLGSGGWIELTGEQANAWLTALNDLRLTLGTRLEVTEDHEVVFGRLPENDPRKAAWYIYDWLSFLQQTLVEAFMGD